MRLHSKECGALVHIEFIAIDVAIFTRSMFFGPPLRSLVDYNMERGGMPLHHTVGVNCINGATTENQGSSARCMG